MTPTKKSDTEDNIVEECYRVNRRTPGQGFTINLYRTTSNIMVNSKDVRVFIQEILPAISETVKARKTEINKLDEEIESALKQNSKKDTSTQKNWKWIPSGKQREDASGSSANTRKVDKHADSQINKQGTYEKEHSVIKYLSFLNCG